MDKMPLSDGNKVSSVHGYQYNRISFWLNGQPLSADIPPAQTTLEFLQQSQQLFGTKCSCNEGDCGACTVVVASAREGRIVYEAVNSCLYNAAKLHGKHLITIEGLGTPDNLHPIQKAMLEMHATQCGYCTPGFVMSMFALFATHASPSEESILSALEGNLCRCTGYDSILKAARIIAESCPPQDILPDWCRALEPALSSFHSPQEYVGRISERLFPCKSYYLPGTLAEFAELIRNNPDSILLNGGTDIMVQMNIQRREYPLLLDLSCIAELKRLAVDKKEICIGANVTYSGLLGSVKVCAALPCLEALLKQVASLQIRNFATLAGNIANASPIGDSLPLLLVLDAELLLFSGKGERRLPLKDFFLGYRKTALLQGEIIKEIVIPLPPQTAFIRSIKAAKRKAVDISAVVSAVRIESQQGKIKLASLALGGVAPVPLLSKQFYKALINMELQGLHPAEIADFVAQEFAPIADVRGSLRYRSLLIRNHVFKYLTEFLKGRQA